MTDIYCLKCRKFTPNIDEKTVEITVKKSMRKVLKATCSVCGIRKNKFLKNDIINELQE